MKARKSKKMEYIQALASKDKDKLRKAISANLPDKYFTFTIKEDSSVYYQGEIITEAEVNSMIEEAEKNYNVTIIKIVFKNEENSCNKESYKILEDRESDQILGLKII